ncbi:hypothetical protein HL653_18160 [Sphingomonas sp. AP4-R1]|uniref:hypothetical protein n=1 Tax=Sphingomonas sp. AP4-R1 TaxID=2735134 RepID=UPI00149334B4|nr:hypothetical protein [Sphingomonas sp. AP4-R1]QJU59422.1 hypothetical protein HL653_18160 [Sphingomonas sp. AP4-R1]
MNESMILSLIAGAMVLVLLVGNLTRRNMKPGESLKLALIWIAIIGVATVAVTLIQRQL